MMQRFKCLRRFHVALVGKFIDAGDTRILSVFDLTIYCFYGALSPLTCTPLLPSLPTNIKRRHLDEETVDGE